MSCAKCCQAPWNIYVSPQKYKTISEIVLQKWRHTDLHDFLVSPESTSNPRKLFTLKRKQDNKCVFLNETTNLCNLQSEFGHSVLPDSCQTFPRMRLSLRDQEYYVLSSSCPSVQKLYNQENKCKLIDHKEFDLSEYPDTIKYDTKTTISLKNTTLHADAYDELRNYFMSCFNNTSFQEVDDIVFYICQTMTDLFNTPSEHQCDVKFIKDYIEKRKQDLDTNRTHKELQGLPIEIKPHLSLLGSWLKLRFGLGIINHEKMISVIHKYGPQDLKQSQPELYQDSYHRSVKPLLQEHHWIVRNYLASKIFSDPFSLYLDCFAQPFIRLFFAYGLVRMILIEDALKEAPLSQQHLYDALEIVDENTLHHTVMDKNISELIKKSNVTLPAFFSTIRI